MPRQVFLLLLPLRGHAASSRPLGEREVAKRRLLSVREARNNKMGLLHSCKGDSSQRRSVSEPDGQPSASRRGKVPRAEQTTRGGGRPGMQLPGFPLLFLPSVDAAQSNTSFLLRRSPHSLFSRARAGIKQAPVCLIAAYLLD